MQQLREVLLSYDTPSWQGEPNITRVHKTGCANIQKDLPRFSCLPTDPRCHSDTLV